MLERFSLDSSIIRKLFCSFLYPLLYYMYVFLSHQFPSICTQKSKHEGFGDIFDKLRDQIPAPVDFELPDWLKKSKPMHYSYIKRSILQYFLRSTVHFCGCFPILSKILQPLLIFLLVLLP